MSLMPLQTDVEHYETFWRLAQRIGDTEFVPDALRRRPEAVLAAIIFGHEVGIGPMQALQSINVIKGKPSPSPELMRALVAKRGFLIQTEHYSDESVTLRGFRDDTGQEERVTWTPADAERAQLVRGNDSSWAKYPRAMLLARATSELCRLMFSDVVAGLSYVPEEVESFSGGEPAPPPQRPPMGAGDTSPAAAFVNQPAELPPADPETGEVVEVEVVDKPKRTRKRAEPSSPPPRPPLPGEEEIVGGESTGNAERVAEQAPQEPSPPTSNGSEPLVEGQPPDKMWFAQFDAYVTESGVEESHWRTIVNNVLMGAGINSSSRKHLTTTALRNKVMLALTREIARQGARA